MDWIDLKNKGVGFLKRFRYPILILVLGVVFLLVPGRNEDQSVQQAAVSSTQTQADPAVQLKKILEEIQGVGKVEVMLSISAGQKTIYQVDENISSGENGTIHKETVIVTGTDRAQTGLIQQVIEPTYLGAIVVCQGADKATVKLAVTEAVSKITGLGADRITVLKMK